MPDAAPAPAQGTPKAEAAEPKANAATVTVSTSAGPAVTAQAPKPAAEVAKPEATAEKAPEAKPAVPEKYELALPEGSLLEAKALEDIASFAKERGFSQNQAQALVERLSADRAAHVESLKAELAERDKAWVSELQSDKEFGGEKYKDTVQRAHEAMKRFGDEALMDELDATRLGNYPKLVKMLARIGKAMENDRIVVPGAQGNASPRSDADVLFPMEELTAGQKEMA